MRAPQKRLMTILILGPVLALGLGLVLFALGQKVDYFFTPTELVQKATPPTQRVRVGGLVVRGSLARTGTQAQFAITDTHTTLKIGYEGVLPDLFREGQSIIASGHMTPDGQFVADQVLAKHDETYMPPEVARMLKARGIDPSKAGEHPDTVSTETMTP